METISLNEFLQDFVNCHKKYKHVLDVEKKEYMICPKCNRTNHKESAKFCYEDGNKLELKEENYRSRDTELEIIRLIYDFSSLKVSPKFLYEYVDNYEVYDDDHSGDAYFDHYVFKRKSDGKHFEISISVGSHETELGGNTLYEVKQVTETKTKWR